MTICVCVCYVVTYLSLKLKLAVSSSQANLAKSEEHRKLMVEAVFLLAGGMDIFKHNG